MSTRIMAITLAFTLTLAGCATFKGAFQPTRTEQEEAARQFILTSAAIIVKNVCEHAVPADPVLRARIDAGLSVAETHVTAETQTPEQIAANLKLAVGNTKIASGIDDAFRLLDNLTAMLEGDRTHAGYLITAQVIAGCRIGLAFGATAMFEHTPVWAAFEGAGQS